MGTSILSSVNNKDRTLSPRLPPSAAFPTAPTRRPLGGGAHPRVTCTTVGPVPSGSRSGATDAPDPSCAVTATTSDTAGPPPEPPSPSSPDRPPPRRPRLLPAGLPPPGLASLSLVASSLLAHAGALEPDATVDDDPYYTGGAYYYVQPADDDQE
ncbi:neural Wiskott-Aldrich syndrome protein-like [Triticum aestivum]|uniref:neural Wiskott-Aldrich syndrome protein-like n=1 Tax=Triticum aestivum TaxID=4565 RepID=UPI001D007B9A|nr:neural Wiskott-Aldrich syndrome protein-like [Triticum aestivum]